MSGMVSYLDILLLKTVFAHSKVCESGREQYFWSTLLSVDEAFSSSLGTLIYISCIPIIPQHARHIMIFTRVRLLTIILAILTAPSSAEHYDQLAIADFPLSSSIPPSFRYSDDVATLPSQEDEPSKQDSQALGARDITFGWYSRAYNKDNLRQWIFGNATNKFNISLSNCIKSTDVAGVYQLMNGTNLTDATVGDIYTDLGYRNASIDRNTRVAHTLVNAQAAYNEILAFSLTSIFCSGGGGNELVRDELRRQLLFRSDGRVLTVVLQGASGMVAYFLWNGIGLVTDNPGIKLIFGGIGTFFLIVVLGLLDILRQEGRIEPLEAALIGSVFVAKARSVIQKMMQSGQANQDAGPCLPATQMAAAVASAGSGSAPVQDLGLVASADVSEIQAACAAEAGSVAN